MACPQCLQSRGAGVWLGRCCVGWWVLAVLQQPGGGEGRWGEGLGTGKNRMAEVAGECESIPVDTLLINCVS